MRKIINLPTNDQFFGRYAHLLPTLKLSSFIAQLISAMTEIGVIWTIIYYKVIAVLPQWAFEFATIGAIAGTLFLELGLRKFVPFSVNAFLYKRFKGLDLVMTFFILLSAAILIGASGLLSFNGAKEIVDNLSDPPKVQTTDHQEQLRTQRLKDIGDNYSNDVNLTNSSFSSEIAAVNASYEAQIGKQQEKMKKYERKEKNSGKSYRSTKDRILAETSRLKALKAEATAKLEKDKSSKLAMLLNAKTSSLNKVESNFSKEVDEIKTKNRKAVEKSERKTENYGLGLGWFTVICLCLFILMAIIIEVIKKGSGIEETATPTQFDFEDNIFVAGWQAISERVETLFRTKIQNFANNTPPPPQPIAPAVLFDKSNAKNEIVKVEFEHPDEPTKITFPPISENHYQQKKQTTSKRKMGFKIGGSKNVQNLNSGETFSKTYSPTATHEISGINSISSKSSKPTKNTITYAGIHNEIEPREYTYSKVQSLISKHKKRIAEAKAALKNGAGKREQNALENNQMRLRYWQNRIPEFFE